MLRIALLGQLEVSRDRVPVAVPAGKVSELLARLAVDGGTVIHADRLLDDLWAAEAIATRRNTLQAKVKTLRQVLGDPALVTTRDGGYALNVDASVVDALSVNEEALAAANLVENGDDRAAAEVAGAALRLYRGTPLTGVGSGDWLTPYRSRFETTQAALLHTYCSARLRLGEATGVVNELESAVTLHPFREDLWLLLVTALYRSGRQADALAAVQRVKALLAEELGLDLGPALTELEQKVLVQAASLAERDRSQVGVTSLPPGNLPSLRVPLVGRDPDVAELTLLVGTERLVEIIGPGGVGKTAVAVEVGRRLGRADGSPHHGVWLARLDTATTANHVIDTVISALNVPGGEDALFERLKTATAVLILDNCEQVAAEVADLAVRLLDAAPGLRILCTSQLALGVPGETLFELAPLELDSAVDLFTRLATAQRAGHHSGADELLVQDLCRSLDGLPLAIELAAARTRTLSVEEIIRRLDRPFMVLSDPSSRQPERRRSLWSTIQWSYDLLFPDDQRGLWAVATFAGGAPLPAVESVLGALGVPPAAAIDVVGRLVNRSLLSVEQDRGATRYRLLDSIRGFALTALSTAGLRDQAMQAHARWFADAAAESTAGVRGGDQAEHLALARAERANIDAALVWCRSNSPLLGVHIATGFGWAWVVLGDSRGGQRILEALAAAGDTVPLQDRARALLLAGWLDASTGDLEPARAHVTSAAETAEQIDDDDLRARAAYYLAYVVSHHGDWAQALELTDRSRRIYDALDRPWDQAANGLFEARAALSAGDPARGADALGRVQGRLRDVDDPWLHVRFEAALGELARVERRFDDAVQHIGLAARTSAELGFVQTEAYQLSSLGRAECQAGNYESGCATLRVAVEKAEAAGDVRLAALGRVHLGRALRALGDEAAAREALEAASVWHGRVGGGEQRLLGDTLLAALDARDRRAAAEGRLSGLLAEARARHDAPVEVFAMDALARLAAERHNTELARDLSSQADRRMADASHFITERDRTDRVAG